jgi:hypothetical protein
MSHFTVLVTGSDIKEALAPYHEFECTGRDDEYVQTVDKTDKYHEYHEKYDTEQTFEEYVQSDGIKLLEGEPDLDKEHKYGYYTKVGDEIRVFARTNPNKKWDWYQVGGRWSGKLLHRNGGYVNSLQIKDLDLSRMRDQTELEAVERFEAYRDCFEGQEIPKLGQERGRDNLEDYEHHPVIQAIRAVQATRKEYGLDIDRTFCGGDLEKVRKQARTEACICFAALDGGVWRERGRMGWFGCVSGEQEDWDSQFAAWLDNLDPETQVTIVDCHI